MAKGIAQRDVVRVSTCSESDAGMGEVKVTINVG
ncbi:hypothetical protein BJ917_4695 [Pseudomonas sp. WPR_5_2]|nr:hypothetical protein BJ917_4695 [Pseudomonas sp. WPR_5_2]